MNQNLIFAALSDPTRRAIVERLAQGEATVAELAQPFAISQPAVSRHLRLLEDAGLIETRVAGSTRPRRLRPETLRGAAEWFGPLLAAMDQRFRALDALLETMPDQPSERTEP